jgi:kynureninase
VPAEQAVLRVLDEWRTLGIAGWLDAAPPWFELAAEIAGLLAPLVGAAADEVGVGDTTTINLHKLLGLLYHPTPARPKLLADELTFPSDLYALRSHARLRGRDPAQDVVLVRSRDGYTLCEDDIAAAMTADVQMVVVPSVLYRSGQLLDIAGLAWEARAREILVAVDCSHSVGAVPHHLDAWGVDCAFWSSYKSLNGGPGAVAGWYLNRRHFGRVPGLAGWFASRKERQFDMAAELDPAPDAACLQVGTPHVLSMAPLSGTLRMIGEAGIEHVREKSLRQTGFLIRLIDDRLSQFGFTIVGPRADDRRGGHVALAHAEALRISKALRAAQVVVDYRPPDLVRLGPSPLYTSFADCCEAVERLEAIMAGGTYNQFHGERDLVS